MRDMVGSMRLTDRLAYALDPRELIWLRDRAEEQSLLLTAKIFARILEAAPKKGTLRALEATPLIARAATSLLVRVIDPVEVWRTVALLNNSALDALEDVMRDLVPVITDVVEAERMRRADMLAGKGWALHVERTGRLNVVVVLKHPPGPQN